MANAPYITMILWCLFDCSNHFLHVSIDGGASREQKFCVTDLTADHSSLGHRVLSTNTWSRERLHCFIGSCVTCAFLSSCCLLLAVCGFLSFFLGSSGLWMATEDTFLLPDVHHICRTSKAASLGWIWYNLIWSEVLARYALMPRKHKHLT